MTIRMPRPDLSRVEPEIRNYIETLEAELAALQNRTTRSRSSVAQIEEEAPPPPLTPSEPPTTINLITISASGLAKRTPRHLYTRQRRGGMGIFDLDTDEDDPPTVLVLADVAQSLLIFTNLARVFRASVHSLPDSAIRSKGQAILGRQPLLPEERIVAAIPDLPQGNVAMVSQWGFVRSLRHHVFGEYMKPGTSMFDPARYGPLAAVCRAPGDSELFIATRLGRAIRFSEKLVPPAGGPGMRVEDGDQAVGITPVEDDSGVFLMDADGRGTLRLMSGFNANKSAGGSGKIAINAGNVVAALTVEEKSDVFAISQLSKIIRFMAAEVPAKEGVVAGVNCMALRADAVSAVTATH